MKRDQLKALGIDDEIIEKIMGLHGATVTDLQDKLNTATTEAKTHKDKVTELSAALETATSATKDIDELRKTVDAQKVQLVGYENRAACAEAGVDPRFHKFVAQEVSANVAEGKDFKAALGEYMKANPQFAAQTPPSGAWGKQQTPPPGGKQETSMDDTIRSRMFPKTE